MFFSHSVASPLRQIFDAALHASSFVSDSCRFDTIYLDDEFRVAKDIRGDTLVVRRGGPPRAF